MIAQIKRDIGRLGGKTFTDLLDLIVTKMPLVAVYLSLATKVTAFAAKVTAYKAADKAVLDNEKEHETLVLLRKASRAALETEYELLARATEGVDSAAANLTEAGWPLRGTSSGPVGRLPAPSNALATASDDEGCIDLTWDAETRSSFYRGQRAISANGPWEDIYQDTKSSFTDRGLTPGTVYFYRFCSHNSAGDSTWSDITSKRSP